jgi:hypothetical protein
MRRVRVLPSIAFKGLYPDIISKNENHIGLHF